MRLRIGDADVKEIYVLRMTLSPASLWAR